MYASPPITSARSQAAHAQSPRPSPSHPRHTAHLAVHIGSAWARSPNHIIYLGALFQLLQEAKLELVHVALTPCAPFQEHEGCPKELLEVRFLAFFSDGSSCRPASLPCHMLCLRAWCS